MNWEIGQKVLPYLFGFIAMVAMAWFFSVVLLSVLRPGESVSSLQSSGFSNSLCVQSASFDNKDCSVASTGGKRIVGSGTVGYCCSGSYPDCVALPGC